MLIYQVSDRVTMKKPHACGENSWTILRTGADIKLQCDSCQHLLWMTRMDFEKRVRKKLMPDGKWVSLRREEPKSEEKISE